eukprot:9483419-Pyramimonas_sp.AAC.1
MLLCPASSRREPSPPAAASTATACRGGSLSDKSWPRPADDMRSSNVRHPVACATDVAVELMHGLCHRPA